MEITSLQKTAATLARGTRGIAPIVETPKALSGCSGIENLPFYEHNDPLMPRAGHGRFMTDIVRKFITASFGPDRPASRFAHVARPTTVSVF